MKPVIFAILGIILYSMVGVVIEQKLERFSTVSLVLLTTVPMVAVAIVWLASQKATGQAIAFPSGNYLWLALGIGLLYYAADYFFLGAFTSGGNALVIATLVALSPVVTALVKFLWLGSKPNGYQVAAYLCALAAVILVTKSNLAK